MTDPRTDGVLIVGAGHAGAQCAIALRQFGYNQPVTLVTEERDLPYERPPLSKDYLSGEKERERLLLRPAEFWRERNVTILTDSRIVAVDPTTHRVTDARGRGLGYDRLVWAAGGHARRLACGGAELQGVHSIRSCADVDKLKEELPAAGRVVVIGGGYIGLEAAAVLSKLGKQVTVCEALDRVLARVAGESLSRFYQDVHRSHGVDVRLGVTVDCIVGANGRARAVRLGDGSELPADLVIVGVGIVPAIEPLVAAGAAAPNGVDVDAFCRTSLADIYAIGDCAHHANDFAGGARIRLESVQNANDQATTVARHIMGEETPYHAIPWFWSHQYDLKLQTVGLSTGHDEVLLRGDPGARTFSLIYLREGRVIALDCVNSTRDYVQGRRLVEAGLVCDRTSLIDLSRPLKEIAANGHFAGVQHSSAARTAAFSGKG